MPVWLHPVAGGHIPVFICDHPGCSAQGIFGYGCNLRRFMETENAEDAGTWYCATHDRQALPENDATNPGSQALTEAKSDLFG